MVRFLMPRWSSNRLVWRVSSQAIKSTSFNTRSARNVISSRLPIGVATRYSGISSFLNSVVQITVLPQPDPALHPNRIADDFDILPEVEPYVSRVASPDVELIEMGQCAERFDRFRQSPVPSLGADPFQGAIAQLLFVGLPFAEGDVSQFDVRRQSPIFKQRRTYAGPECDHQLDALALDRP